MPPPPAHPAATRHESELGFRIWRLRQAGVMAAPHTHPDIEVNFLFSGGFSYLHGGAITPVPFGYLIDKGHPELVLVLVAVLLLASLFCAGTARKVAARDEATAAAPGD